MITEKPKIGDIIHFHASGNVYLILHQANVFFSVLLLSQDGGKSPRKEGPCRLLVDLSNIAVLPFSILPS